MFAPVGVTETAVSAAVKFAIVTTPVVIATPLIVAVSVKSPVAIAAFTTAEIFVIGPTNLDTATHFAAVAETIVGTKMSKHYDFNKLSVGNVIAPIKVEVPVNVLLPPIERSPVIVASSATVKSSATDKSPRIWTFFHGLIEGCLSVLLI